MSGPPTHHPKPKSPCMLPLGLSLFNSSATFFAKHQLHEVTFVISLACNVLSCIISMSSLTCPAQLEAGLCTNVNSFRLKSLLIFLSLKINLVLALFDWLTSLKDKKAKFLFRENEFSTHEYEFNSRDIETVSFDVFLVLKSSLEECRCIFYVQFQRQLHKC